MELFAGESVLCDDFDHVGFDDFHEGDANIFEHRIEEGALLLVFFEDMADSIFYLDEGEGEQLRCLLRKDVALEEVDAHVADVPFDDVEILFELLFVLFVGELLLRDLIGGGLVVAVFEGVVGEIVVLLPEIQIL